VGYDIIEHVPPESVGYISATQIREQIREGNDVWKESVDEKIHDAVYDYLKG